MQLHAVRMTLPKDANIILARSHFIKTVEDVAEALINTVPGVQYAVAFNEASGPCLVRVEANDAELGAAAVENARALGAGHCLVVLLRKAYPINVLARLRDVPEVCEIVCATANPLEVIVAETEQGRGVLGVIDGSSPRGVEGPADVQDRKAMLRKFGYKF
ncbi:MAG TPA: adenosine-specific kinase [Myxococcota bacterium]|nr:adenosine-specific kinase [Myxococcota bacterium]HRY94336.1 adenosine-specific kinase [Myxococcota bacterium]HSA21217.1 adenosine-specific kinase [Myxococcota bacterium]